MRQYIVVASQADAKIYQEKKVSQPLELIKVFNNPSGTLHNREFFSDHPNRAAGGLRSNAGHLLAMRENPHKQAIVHLAREVTNFVEREAEKTSVKDVVFIASPRLLGILRKETTRKPIQFSARWINKDLAKLTSTELKNYLNEWKNKTAA